MTEFAVGPPRWPGVLASWSFEPAVVVALAGAALAYRRGCRAVAAAHPAHPVPTPVRSAFLGGLAVLAVALLSPLATYAEALLSVHMAQHLLMTLVAAPLLLLGRPLTVAALAAPAFRRHLRRVGRMRMWDAVGHPLVAWISFAVAGWAIHFSPFFDAALDDPALHGLEHALFLGSALLFWWPVAGHGRPLRRRLSHPLRLLYLALAMPQNTFLAMAVVSSSTVLYDHYARLARSWGPSPLSDQRHGGGLMWAAGDLALLASVLLVAAAWARHEDRQARSETAQQPLSGPPAGRSPSPRTAG